MKAEELRNLSEEKLLKLKEQMEIELFKSKAMFVKAKSGNKANIKGTAKMGVKTKLTKDIRRNLARINTILNEKRKNRN